MTVHLRNFCLQILAASCLLACEASDDTPTTAAPESAHAADAGAMDASLGSVDGGASGAPSGRAEATAAVTPPTSPADASASAPVDASVAALADASVAAVVEASVPAVVDASVPALVSDAAGAADASQSDAAGPDASAPALASCPVADACPLAEYPCVASDDGLGFSCRGQYAAWPMPDTAPGAAVAPHYTVREVDGVVLDEVTGLLWQRDIPDVYEGCTRQLRGKPGDGCTFDEAGRYCSQLTLSGGNWRVPSKIELESLLFHTGMVGRYIDPTAFPASKEQEFWTATRTDLAGEANALSISFLAGFPRLSSPTEAKLARCVRNERNPDAPPSRRYVVDAAQNTVRDSFTKLEWQRGASAQVPSADEAAAVCASAGAGFRVPTVKELLTLEDAVAADTVESPMFEDLDDRWLLWSTTVSFSGERRVYSASTGLLAEESNGAPTDPDAGTPELAFSLHVRCVR